MQKSPRIAEISTKVIGGLLFYVHPVCVGLFLYGLQLVVTEQSSEWLCFEIIITRRYRHNRSTALLQQLTCAWWHAIIMLIIGMTIDVIIMLTFYTQVKQTLFNDKWQSTDSKEERIVFSEHRTLNLSIILIPGLAGCWAKPSWHNIHFSSLCHSNHCSDNKCIWWDWSLILRTFLQCFDTVVGSSVLHKPVPDMTYVFGGTLNLTQPTCVRRQWQLILRQAAVV